MSEPRHPLLAISAAARRELARTLLRGLAAERARAVAERRRAGLRGAAAVGGTGLGLFAAWTALAGGAALPFAAAYAGLVTLQALAARRLIGAERPDSPRWVRAARVFALGPADAAEAVRDGLAPPRITPDRLVLAAGLLVVARRPLSRTLVRRMAARAYPQAEVDHALELLLRLGWLVTRPGTPGVLVLSPTGVTVLRALGVKRPQPRAQRDPAIAPHLLPVFEGLGGTRRSAPPRHDGPPPEVVAPSARRPAEVTRALAADTVQREVPRVERPARRVERPIRRFPAIRLAAACTVLLAGALLLQRLPVPSALGPRDHVVVSADAMPHSRGTALQFNGRGFLLSSFDGGLFLSIPERLDFKKPISFQGHDMAADCGLVDREIRAARVSPLGRFLWTELGSDGAPGGRERCLVDLETKTVVHDLPGKAPAYGLPHVVGWAGPQTLLMATEAPPEPTAHWWAVDVVSHAATKVGLPQHARLLPLATEGGPALLGGLDPDPKTGAWALTTYWLAEGHVFKQVRRIKTDLPAGEGQGDPRHAAISPDKRWVLLGLQGQDAGLPAATGSLVVVSLEDGAATPLETTLPPLIEAPMFWGPEVRDRRYRFYFNGMSADGVVPSTGEMVVRPG